LNLQHKTYLYQFLLLLLISLITIKPSIQLICSLAIDKDDIELNENIEDIEDFEEIKADFNEDVFFNDFILSSNLISTNSKLVFDSYSKQAINMFTDVSTPPPKQS